MRTQEEILARIAKLKTDGADFFGFETNDLIFALDYEHAKPFLKEGTKEEDWRSVMTPREKMIDYMPFAWEKANDCRGLSAGRSISHFSAWLWLDGNGALADSIRNYEFYGKPQLVEICKYLGLDPSVWDDGKRTNSG